VETGRGIVLSFDNIHQTGGPLLLRRFSGLLLVAWVLSLSTLARAADGPVADMPWLHEGLSLGYAWHAAHLPGNGNEYVEDDGGRPECSSPIKPSTGCRGPRSRCACKTGGNADHRG
jgi:hypothetical protein